MASKDYKQDMLVSIRYRNDLPPPPMPPKLLDIPHSGLSQYLDPSFTSSLARREEPNIEADAEGGLPIDVVGMYGYFDGDESSILAPVTAPALDPEDEALMVTYEQLKAGGKPTETNFLMKASQLAAPAIPVLTGRPAKRAKTVNHRPTVTARDDKENIIRSITKAFDLSNNTSNSSITTAERNAWSNPVHPTNKSLKPTQFYPVLPNLEAGTGWSVLKFDRPPLPAHNSRRDPRLDASFIMCTENSAELPSYEAKLAAHESNPTLYEHPGIRPAIFSLFTPLNADHSTTSSIRTLFDADNPDNSSEELFQAIGEQSQSGEMRIPILRSKIYPHYQNVLKTDQTRQIVISLNDPNKNMKTDSAAVAQYYPLGALTRLRADRNLNASQRRDLDLEEGMIDQLLVKPIDPTPEDLEARYAERARHDSKFEREYQKIQSDADELRRQKDQADRPDEVEAGVDPVSKPGDVSMQDVDTEARQSQSNGDPVSVRGDAYSNAPGE